MIKEFYFIDLLKQMSASSDSLFEVMTKGRNSEQERHQFGGDWTAAKLDVLAGYLEAYTTALKRTPFKLGYIDAFAGTGYREAKGSSEEVQSEQSLLFPDLAQPEPQELLEGSALRALKTEPRFDRYIFIERSAGRCSQLEQLRQDFPQLAREIIVRKGEANEEIREMCRHNWSAHRAVLFLDPYGMQVEWKTIEAVASTKAIDLWLLFPLGIGVNRLLTKSSKIPDSWRQKLNLLLGTDQWYEEFYQVEVSATLFGAQQARVIKASMATIGRYFNERLKGVFAGVAEPPGVLRNSSNNPLYLLCFAVGNDHGKGIALRIANHLLKELR